MRGNIEQQGASLLLVVIVTMAVLAGLVMVTSNLAFSARRSTTEQKSIIPAQLSAESGLSYAKAKLDAANQLLSNAGIPEKTTKDALYTALGNLCPTPVALPLNKPATNSTIVTSKTRLPNDPLPPALGTVTIPTTNIVTSGKLICELNNEISPEQAELFNILVSGSGGQILTADKDILDTDNSRRVYQALGIENNDKARADFFSDVFSYKKLHTISNASVSSGLQPLALVEVENENMGQKRYQLFMRVAPVETKGNVANATRLLNIEGNKTIHRLDIYFEVERVGKPSDPGVPDSFTGYGLFVNDFDVNQSGEGGFYDSRSRFSGPFHSNTNMKLSFNYDASTSSFNTLTIDGALTSASCSRITTGADGQDQCERPNDKLWMADNGHNVYSAQTANFKDLGTINKNGEKIRRFGLPHNSNLPRQNQGLERVINVVDRGDQTIAPRFDSSFVPLPINATNQRNMAVEGGILLSNPELVQLSIDKGAGIQKIAITVKENGYSNTTTTIGFDKDNNMKILVNGQWKPAVKDPNSLVGWREKTDADKAGIEKFNGMLYADNNIKSLTGPLRNSPTSASANGEPAIASFAQLTITAENDITVSGDLKTEIPCRSIDACTGKNAKGEYNVKNMLGIYAAKGDILLPYTGGYSQSVIPQSGGSGSRLQAPRNLELDAFIMSARKTIKPIYSVNDSFPNLLYYAKDYGNFSVFGGTVKNKEDNVKVNDSGWLENYMFDGRGVGMSPPGFPTTKKGKEGKQGDEQEGRYIATWKGALNILDSNSEVAKDNSGHVIPNTFSLDKEIIQGKEQ